MLQTPFWHPQPRRPRHQGHINSFFLEFKRLFGTPNPAGKDTKATLQTLQTLFWHSQPHRQRHQGHINIAFSWRSSLPFARPQTLQTLQTLQMPFWHPQPRRPRHQDHSNSFFLAFKPAVCQASNPPNLPNAFLAPRTLQAKTPKPPSKRSKRLFGTPNPANKNIKATSVAFSWRSSLPFARPQTLQTLQTLQMPFWHPQPRRQRHQGHINSFLAPPTLQAKAPGPHQ